MIDKQAFATRIVHATKSQLVVINFELITAYINEANFSLGGAENKVDFMTNIKNSRNFLYELISSLDMKYKISSELFELYKLIDQKILKFLYTEDFTFGEEAISVIQTIQEAFIELDKQEEDNTPMMDNAEVIYSGLTYNKNMTHTEYINPSTNRGFQA